MHAETVKGIKIILKLLACETGVWSSGDESRDIKLGVTKP